MYCKACFICEIRLVGCPDLPCSHWCEYCRTLKTHTASRMISQKTFTYLSYFIWIGAFLQFFNFRMSHNRKLDIWMLRYASATRPTRILLTLAMSIELLLVLNCVVVLSLQQLRSKDALLVACFIAALCFLFCYQVFHFCHTDSVLTIFNNYLKLNQRSCKFHFRLSVLC